MEKYIITKVLSNNVVLVKNYNENYILVGKGIGFNKKRGDELQNPKNIEQRFMSLEGLNNNDYEKFFTKINPKVIELVENIIAMVSYELGETLDPNIHVALIDHINFAIKRMNEGIEIINPFLFETKALYPVEYKLAEKAVRILKDKLNIDMPESEIGFLTLYIYGGRTNKTQKDALGYSKMMSEITDYVEHKLQIKLDKESFDYSRFIMHLKGVKDRVLENKCIENLLLSKIKHEFRLEFRVAYDISKIMERHLKMRIPETEIGYITVHVYKLRSENK